MKITVIGRNRPFWDGKLRKLKEVLDIPKKVVEATPGRWMGVDVGGKLIPAAKVEEPKEKPKPKAKDVSKEPPAI